MGIEEPSKHSGIVIVGAGLAGWHVIDAIRSKDKEIPITLITADNADRYHKPMLTMAISQDKKPADLVRAAGEQAAKTANVTLLAHTQVSDIDAASQTLQLVSANRSDPANTNYAVINYDKLVLAMGAHPIFPKSLPESLVWHVNHIERFGQLQEKLSTGSQHVAIVGAGIIDLNDAPLAQMLPAKATARIRQAIESQGIEFLGGYQVTDVVRNEDDRLEVSYEPLENVQGQANTMTVDHVIASTGLVVDDKLPAAAGIEFNPRTGIVVDAPTLRTNANNVYAIGDCMSIDGVACRYVAPLRAQAATIADDILGHAHAGYDHKPPMIRLKNKAIAVTVVGVPQATGNWQVKTETTDELVMELFDDATDDKAVKATVSLKVPAKPAAKA